MRLYLPAFLRKKELRDSFEIFPDDVFLVSYPKSGNTWLRFLIGNYISGNKCDFRNSHLLVPDIHSNPSDCKSLNRPRIIKSHFAYTANYPRVVYLARDGRDVAVSYFFHQKKYHIIDQDMSFEKFMQKFNSRTIDNFGGWGDHVISWLDSKKEGALLIRYEDLLDNAANNLSSILAFCGLSINSSRIESAIEHSSFFNMRQAEKNQQERNRYFEGSDKSISFVREGKKGQWQNYFNDDLLEDFMSHHGRAMKRLGYT